MQVLNKNLDKFPYVGIRVVDGKVRVLTHDEAPHLDNFFNGTPWCEQVKNLTRGHVYQAIRKEGFGHVELITVIDDAGEERTFDSALFDNVPDDTPLSESNGDYFQQLQERVLAQPLLSEVECHGKLVETRLLSEDPYTVGHIYEYKEKSEDPDTGGHVYKCKEKQFMVVYQEQPTGRWECVNFGEFVRMRPMPSEVKRYGRLIGIKHVSEDPDTIAYVYKYKEKQFVVIDQEQTTGKRECVKFGELVLAQSLRSEVRRYGKLVNVKRLSEDPDEIAYDEIAYVYKYKEKQFVVVTDEERTVGTRDCFEFDELVLARPSLSEVKCYGKLVDIKQLSEDPDTIEYVYKYKEKHFVVIYQEQTTGKRECIKFDELPENVVVTETDELHQALRNPNAAIQYMDSDTEIPRFVLFGKQEVSRRYDDENKPIVDACYNICENKDVSHPNADFTMYYIHDYDDVKEFIDKRFGISYPDFLKQFIKEKSNIIHKP